MINQNLRTLDAGREKELPTGALQPMTPGKASTALPPLFGKNAKVTGE